MGRVYGGSLDSLGVLRVRLVLFLTIFVVVCYDSLSTVVVEASFVANGIRDGSRFYCFRGYKRCMSGIQQCILPNKECDGVRDCADGSDEGTHCASYDCVASGRYRCPSGRNCMNVTDYYGNWRYGNKDPYANYLCDGVRDCADGSDEAQRFCSSCAAPPHTPVPMTLDWFVPSSPRVRCPSGKGCLYQSQLCDGVVQCLADGGSDEKDSLCKSRGCSRENTNTFQCRSGRCIDKEKMCDGKIDCPNGDDEGSWCARITCPYGHKCPNGNNQTCVSDGQICDGVADCPGGTDEVSCATIHCPWGDKCPSGNQCSRSYNILCDGVRNCRDGSDEAPAFCRRFDCSSRNDGDHVKCRDGLQCVSKSSQCDGYQDCKDGSDEDPSFCRRRNCSANGDFYVRCPGRSGGCVYIGGLCDRNPDCIDSSDEDPTYCASDLARDVIAASDRIRCDNNRTTYIYGHYCDGAADCSDGSDERRSLCTGYQCPRNFVKCYGTWCVNGAQCDGYVDCPDRSDEMTCPRSISPIGSHLGPRSRFFNKPW